MNKSDVKLLVFVLGISLFVYSLIYFFEPKSEKEALVYYKDEIILVIDLSDFNYKSFSVMGENGWVVIESSNGKVRVVEETSPLHICSKQGWVNTTYNPIVCLPNNVIIKIVSKTSEVDAVVN